MYLVAHSLYSSSVRFTVTQFGRFSANSVTSQPCFLQYIFSYWFSLAFWDSNYTHQDGLILPYNPLSDLAVPMTIFKFHGTNLLTGSPTTCLLQTAAAPGTATSSPPTAPSPQLTSCLLSGTALAADFCHGAERSSLGREPSKCRLTARHHREG